MTLLRVTAPLQSNEKKQKGGKPKKRLKSYSLDQLARKRR